MINFDCRLESGEIIKQEPANTLIENIMLLLKQEGLTVLAATFILDEAKREVQNRAKL